jgi:hypothetical protein
MFSPIELEPKGGRTLRRGLKKSNMRSGFQVESLRVLMWITRMNLSWWLEK